MAVSIGTDRFYLVKAVHTQDGFNWKRLILLKERFPHSEWFQFGQADFSWGKPSTPRVVLIGTDQFYLGKAVHTQGGFNWDRPIYTWGKPSAPRVVSIGTDQF